MILRKSAGQKPKKLLIINPFGIGDVLFTTPVIRAIRKAYPDIIIGYWCNSRVSPLIKSGFNVDTVFALSRGDIKKLFNKSVFCGLRETINLVFSLRKEHFDICFDFSLDHRYSLFSKIIGIKKRVGFDYKGRGRFLTEKIKVEGYNEKHAIEYYLDLLDLVGIESDGKSMQFSLMPADVEKTKDILSAAHIENGDLVVGIVPGAGGSWGKDAAYKHWPALKFAQAADRLISELKAKVILIGDASENPIADVIVTAMRGKPVNLIGKVSLGLLPTLIKSCNILITNDGGPMHLGVALDVKTVSIFGPVSDIVYGPYPKSPKHSVLSWNGECRPCYRNFRLPICDKERECLKSISVEAVFNAAVSLLGDSK